MEVCRDERDGGLRRKIELSGHLVSGNSTPVSAGSRRAPARRTSSCGPQGADVADQFDYSNPETEWFEAELDRRRLGLTDIILCEVPQGLRDETTAIDVERELLKLEVFESGGVDVARDAPRRPFWPFKDVPPGLFHLSPTIWRSAETGFEDREPLLFSS